MRADAAAQGKGAARRLRLAERGGHPGRLTRTRTASGPASGRGPAIIAYNTKLITEDQVPKRVKDLADPKLQEQGRRCRSRSTGTTLTHVCALYARDGKDKTDAWLEALLANDVRFTPRQRPGDAGGRGGQPRRSA